MKKETMFFDADDNIVEPENAIRAEVRTLSNEGSVLKVEYYYTEGYNKIKETRSKLEETQ